MKTVLYGCGANLINGFNNFIAKYDVIAIVDKNYDKHGAYRGINVFGIEKLRTLDYEKILITIDDYQDCLKDLKMMDISNDKLLLSSGGGHLWNDINIIPLYGGGMKCNFDGVKFLVKNRSDIGVMNSIFANNSWDFHCEGNCIVIDVGMNIGLASLFFANMDYVEKVYGFEPFPMTYCDALENFKLNPSLVAKIQSFNYGLSNKDHSMTCLYDPEYTTNMRTDDEVRQHGSNEFSVDIQLKDSYEVLKGILNSEKITVLKLDCEGAEYDIVRRLDETGLLEKVDIILAETHDGKENILKGILKKNHFIYFDNYMGDFEQLGFLYAVKK